MSKEKQVRLIHLIATGFLSSLNRDSKFPRLMTSEEGSFTMDVVLAISIEKLYLLIAMQDSKNRIIIQDIYLSTVLTFPLTLFCH